LAVVGVAVTVWVGRRGPGSAAFLLAAAFLSGAFALGQPSRCDTETAYYCVAINTDATDPDVRVLVLDSLTHAAVDLRDPTNLEFGYLRRFADATAAPRASIGSALAVLHVGGGGFTFPRYLQALHPASRQIVLELDPRILEIAQTDLGFTPSEGIEVRLGDARQSIRALPSDSFDFVFGDAFGGLAVPWHLTTAEFLDEVTRVLRPGGAYVMNVIDSPRLGFVRAMAATGASRFPHVAVISGRGTIEGHGGGNLVVVASETPLDQASIEASIATWGELAQTAVVADPAEVSAFIGDSVVLTDDFAPVDQLLGR
jgi:spermidine synthase